jgi:hypothetical protein
MGLHSSAFACYLFQYLHFILAKLFSRAPETSYALPSLDAYRATTRYVLEEKRIARASLNFYFDPRSHSGEKGNAQVYSCVDFNIFQGIRTPIKFTAPQN